MSMLYLLFIFFLDIMVFPILSFTCLLTYSVSLFVLSSSYLYIYQHILHGFLFCLITTLNTDLSMLLLIDCLLDWWIWWFNNPYNCLTVKCTKQQYGEQRSSTHLPTSAPSLSAAATTGELNLGAAPNKSIFTRVPSRKCPSITAVSHSMIYSPLTANIAIYFGYFSLFYIHALLSSFFLLVSIGKISRSPLLCTV